MSIILKADNNKEAWNMVDKIFPYDYEKDEDSSNRAGYDIYRCTLRNKETDYYNYICDLGNRIEINLTTDNWIGQTYNIFIEDKKELIIKELRENTKKFYGIC